MKERPIIFSGPMVRAILHGRKTQTRRVIKARRENGLITGPAAEPGGAIEAFGGGAWHVPSRVEVRLCPYGVPGDRLYVKMQWWHYKSDHLEQAGFPGGTITLLDDGPARFHQNDGFDPAGHKIWQRKLARYMPKWAAWIWLEIEDVRVQRVQDISEEDAKAEGAPASESVEMRDGSPCYTLEFRKIWKRIHGIDNPKAWDTNPWVWAITFRRIEPKENGTTAPSRGSTPHGRKAEEGRQDDHQQ